ncbi:MAG: hypothetical protein ACRDZ4_21735 [Egibacteraceae bacterium]
MSIQPSSTLRSKQWPGRLLWLFGLLLAGLLAINVIGLISDNPQPAPSGAAAMSFRTLPPGSALPSGEQCAQRVRRSDWEPRPENTVANHTVPEEVSLPDWDAYLPRANSQLKPRIDGRFTGTTDEIIQWAACKWGFDEDVVRAIAVRESNWVQDEVGDYEDDERKCVEGDSPPCPTSFGLLQIKHYTYPGTFPDSYRSTAFNVDNVLGDLRACYEGWITFLHGDYRAGDLWGCVGYHWSGRWKDQGANRYAQNVQKALAAKPWLKWDG